MNKYPSESLLQPLWIYTQKQNCWIIWQSCLMFEEPPYCLPQWLHQFTFPPNVLKGSYFPTSSPTLVIFCFCVCVCLCVCVFSITAILMGRMPDPFIGHYSIFSSFFFMGNWIQNSINFHEAFFSLNSINFHEAFFSFFATLYSMWDLLKVP